MPDYQHLLTLSLSVVLGVKEELCVLELSGLGIKRKIRESAAHIIFDEGEGFFVLCVLIEV